MEVDLSQVMAGVLSFAPNAVVFEEADGNVSIALNMRLNNDGLLEHIEDEVSDEN